MELMVNRLLCSYLCTYLGKESGYRMYNHLPKKKKERKTLRGSGELHWENNEWVE